MRLPRLFSENPKLQALENRMITRLSRGLKGVDKNKVVFMCFRGRNYGDNPRAISEGLHQLRPETDIVWLFRGGTIHEMEKVVPDYVRAVSIASRKSWVELGTARVWVDNFTKESLLRGFPKGRQFYVQTWHGDRAIKKICYDAFPEGYRLEEECSLVLTGSEFGQRMFRTAFNYRGEYLNMGSPRNDPLVKNDPAEAGRIRRKLGVRPGVKLLLYAPTYREDSDIVPPEGRVDLNRVLDLLEKGGERWLCLYRAHYLSAGVGLEPRKDRLVDVSGYDSMTDLLLAADMLLTDYSSCAMDYCLLDRPFFMYMGDYPAYLASRPCYYDPHDTPLPVADTQAQLEAMIAESDADSARSVCRAVRDYYGMNETGQATDAVCRWIIDRLG